MSHTVVPLYDAFTDEFKGNVVVTVCCGTDEMGDTGMAKVRDDDEIKTRDFMVLPMYAIMRDGKNMCEEEVFLTNCVMYRSRDGRELEVVDSVPVTFPRGGTVTGIHLKHAGMIITVTLSPENLKVAEGDYIHFNNVGIQYGNI